MKERFLAKNYRSLAKAPGDTTKITLNVLLEVLDSCAHRCAGCFVNRSNSYAPEELRRFLEWTTHVACTERNEAIFGPTDVFSATNFDEVFRPDGDLVAFARTYQEISFNSTLNDALARILERTEHLRRIFPGKYLEFFVVVDVEKIYAGDEAYLSQLEAKIRAMGDINLILTANVTENFHQVQDRVVEVAAKRFQTNFKWTPSFLRAKNGAVVGDSIRHWSTHSYLDLNLLDYATDTYFGGVTYKAFAFNRGKAYRVPCLMDFTPVDRAEFELDLSLDEDQAPFLTAPPADECATCATRIACGAKGVHQFKKSYGLSGCVMPRHFKRPA